MDAAETPEGPAGTAYDGGRPAWQHRLLVSGEGPNPRFALGNERTFLAWVWTALAMRRGRPLPLIVPVLALDVLSLTFLRWRRAWSRWWWA